MIDYISISTLNDFIFCPYSIYLHNVYVETDEGNYHAIPQTLGKIAHESVDRKTSTTRSDVILSLPVFSEEYGLMGKIDIYYSKEHKLVERKYHISQIFQGQIYQLWAQMLCLKEMGYPVETLAIYETSTNRTYPINMPSDEDITGLKDFIDKFRRYDPSMTPVDININKCRHCVYCNLCDKTEEDNVFNK